MTEPSPVSAEPVTDYDRDAHLAYPSANGFADAGRSLVVAGRGTGPGLSSLWAIDLATGGERRLGTFPAPANAESLWFDVSEKTGRLALVDGGEVRMIDLSAPDRPLTVYRETGDGVILDGLISLRGDGGRIAVIRSESGRWEIIELDVHSGEGWVIAGRPWWIGHVQYSPHDPDWIGFCHEGATETVPDRVWAWHGGHAPSGGCLFDQTGTGLFMGHECWSWHDRSVVVVAYGVSPRGPRGVYELFADGRPARLVSEGDRDWHVNINRDGRWAVVDTTGPHDGPGRGWENAGMASDIVLIEMTTGRRTPLARTRWAKRHQSHPHPVFSPDGSAIYYNEADESGLRTRVMRVGNPRFDS